MLETEEERGVAHLIEHLAFRASRTCPQEFDLVKEASSAYTLCAFALSPRHYHVCTNYAWNLPPWSTVVTGVIAHTHPGPTFKARLLHNKEGVSTEKGGSPEKGVSPEKGDSPEEGDSAEKGGVGKMSSI